MGRGVFPGPHHGDIRPAFGRLHRMSASCGKVAPVSVSLRNNAFAFTGFLVNLWVQNLIN